MSSPAFLLTTNFNTELALNLNVCNHRGWNWANERDLVPEVLDYVPVLFDGKNETITDFRAAEQE